jgi:2-dehydro-3-deoxy-D-arabinonate dehydratase
MRYVRVDTDDGAHLLATDEEETYDLTADSDGQLRTIADLAAQIENDSESLDDATMTVRDSPAGDFDLPAETLLAIDNGEIWAADSTYEHSTTSRKERSSVPAAYDSLLDADRPELLLKATPQRAVGYGGDVGIRTDSDRNAAEATLAAVACQGSIVGYTVGLGVRSRSIEAENPLYVQQACTYDRCCALGPAIVSTDDVDDPTGLDVSMTVHSNGARVFESTGTTAKLRRTPAELMTALGSHQNLPDPTVLFTGGAVVPSADFTLTAGDQITVQIDSLGALQVTVTTV